MPSIATLVPVSELSLDLYNFRATPQANEVDAIKAMITISPDRFWGLAHSLLDDGYLPTDNVIAIASDAKATKLIVKEGNRRVAILKLAHGFVKLNQFPIPEDIKIKIKSIECGLEKRKPFDPMCEI